MASTRGAAGGYQLIRNPSKVTLGHVMQLMEGNPSQFVSNAAESTPVSQVLVHAWQQVAAAERCMLEDISFADLAERIRDQVEPMYFI